MTSYINSPLQSSTKVKQANRLLFLLGFQEPATDYPFIFLLGFHWPDYVLNLPTLLQQAGEG